MFCSMLLIAQVWLFNRVMVRSYVPPVCPCLCFPDEEGCRRWIVSMKSPTGSWGCSDLHSKCCVLYQRKNNENPSGSRPWPGVFRYIFKDETFPRLKQTFSHLICAISHSRQNVYPFHKRFIITRSDCLYLPVCRERPTGILET